MQCLILRKFVLFAVRKGLPAKVRRESWNPCIFRETKFRDRKFPDRTLQEGTFGDQKIPGIPICHGI